MYPGTKSRFRGTMSSYYILLYNFIRLLWLNDQSKKETITFLLLLSEEIPAHNHLYCCVIVCNLVKIKNTFYSEKCHEYPKDRPDQICSHDISNRGNVTTTEMRFPNLLRDSQRLIDKPWYSLSQHILEGVYDLTKVVGRT